MYDFSKISSEEQAYWLGFLTADASLMTSGKYVNGDTLYSGVCCELAGKDESHLRKMADFFELPYARIKTIARPHYVSPQARIRICSVALAKNLIAHHGWTTNKSLSHRITSEFNGFEYAFIRGYFDGDGHCYQDRRVFASGMCGGSLSFITDLRDLVCRIAGVTSKIYSDGPRYHRIKYTGSKARTLIAAMTVSAGLALERKASMLSAELNQ